ncbi:hypothetical protein KM043_010957 [Ampulex compressa]|nr:hypothetical protein KM043_010957 [Ampulex compressa]
MNARGGRGEGREKAGGAGRKGGASKRPRDEILESSILRVREDPSAARGTVLESAESREKRKGEEQRWRARWKRVERGEEGGGGGDVGQGYSGKATRKGRGNCQQNWDCIVPPQWRAHDVLVPGVYTWWA